ncbi:DUF2268 domain-containing protein [Virgibacillus byunsanensis]|uniref:DUF2268 domain-containing protein n=1 Tax=Virgibacillus byunsanensis TaxID=570945 RepID=A0ABW3LSA2_9BACI
MSVVRTDKWLQESYDDPLKLCKKIKSYFDGVQTSEIYDYLTIHGMYRRPSTNNSDLVKSLQDNKVWQIVVKEKRQLQKLWNGPTIPVFILPSDPDNHKLVKDHNGKSGLAFGDKMFLFLSESNTEMEIRALFTHEYNHVCRLANYQKKENDYVLLDTIMLEGLAENAVRERLGKENTAGWTSYYSQDQLKKIWNSLVRPNRQASKNDRKHHEILYGLHFHPKMAGYCVGYYLVEKYLDKQRITCKDLLPVSSDRIAQLN